MELVLALDAVIVVALVAMAVAKGFEEILPVVGCLLLLFPDQARIQLPGLFDFTTQRVIVLVLCALYVALGRRSIKHAAAQPLPLRYVLAALIGWMLLSSAHSVVPVVSLKSTISQYFDFCSLFYIYVRTVRTRELMDRVLAGLFVGAVLCSLFGVIEIYSGWKVASLFPAVLDRFAGLESVDSRGSRVQSTFDHPILFGAALAMALPLAVYLATKAVSAKEKIFLWSGVGLMMLCLYKTNSRGPWLAAMLAAAVLLVLGSTAMRRSLAAVVLAALLVVALRPGIRDSILNLYGATLDPDSPQGESYQWRYILYDIADRELSKTLPRALWGYGPESFYYLGLTADFSVEGELHTVKVESCDSAVVEIMMDTGYVGLLLVVALLGASALRGWRQYRASSGESSAAYAALLAALFAFCFLMTNVELFGWGQQSYMLWILLAFLATPMAVQSCEPLPKNVAAVLPFVPRPVQPAFPQWPLGMERGPNVLKGNRPSTRTRTGGFSSQHVSRNPSRRDEENA